ncbi:hypothetical protein QW131_32930 [Roseibium salinum]|nr:hypothetical protein [Roseibium salinum]
MPKSLYAYVGKVSARQQLRLCLLTVLVFPLTLVPLELQRRIVNGAIEGQNMDLLVRLGALYLAVVTVQGILKFVRNFYLDRVAEGVTRLLRKRIAHSDGFNSDPDEGTRQAIMSAEAEKGWRFRR